MSIEDRPIRCIVADDHQMLLEAAAEWLGAEEGIEVVGTAADGEQALSLIQRRAPDVAVLDVNMPRLNGIELCQELADQGIRTSVVLYTGEVDRAAIRRGLTAGARAIVLKSSIAADLTRAVRAVAGGETYIEPTLAGSLIEGPSGAEQVLAKRELEVLQLLANGITTEGIAQELSLSPNTVRSYVESAVRKLGARGRTHAVAEAFRRQLIA
jgi:two-component system, NarL family, response regulator DesR